LEKSGAQCDVEVRFRVHWYPFFMGVVSAPQHMEKFGSRIRLEYETQTYDGVKKKTGTTPGTMTSTEKQFQNIPYRSGRPVLLSYWQSLSMSAMWAG